MYGDVPTRVTFVAFVLVSLSHFCSSFCSSHLLYILDCTTVEITAIDSDRNPKLESSGISCCSDESNKLKRLAAAICLFVEMMRRKCMTIRLRIVCEVTGAKRHSRSYRPRHACFSGCR